MDEKFILITSYVYFVYNYDKTKRKNSYTVLTSMQEMDIMYGILLFRLISSRQRVGRKLDLGSAMLRDDIGTASIGPDRGELVPMDFTFYK